MNRTNRIERRFQSLRQRRRKALIPYLTAGDPDADATLRLMYALVAAGADVIELGVPFSDPMADGPVIQKASERALARGMTLRGVLGIVARFRTSDNDTPVVLMGYLNPIEAMGYEPFVRAAFEAGVDGVLTVDLPPEEARDLSPHLENAGLAPIFLIAPTSTEQRIQQVAALARGYVYYVSLKGVTGSSSLNVAEVEDKLHAIRRFTDLPVGVGFGIKDARSAAAVARVADAVVVGSALIAKIAELAADRGAMVTELTALLGSMRHAMDSV